MGMAFSRETWNEIKACGQFFCAYEDYNYDWSLQNVNYRCLKQKLVAMVSVGARIQHIGEW